MDKKKLPDASAFWKWFSENEGVIRDVLDDEFHPMRAEVVESLNNFVLDFGVFTWEVGEGRYKPYYFLISPNANADLLPLSKHIINQSPELGEWEFHYAKQPKDWDLCFTIYDEMMDERAIDASGWRFTLDPQQGKVNVILFPDKHLQLDEYTLQRAADIVVISLVGEEGRIRYIDQITVSLEKSQNELSSVDDLRSAVESMF